MKKTLTLTISFILLGSVLSPNASASVKQGSKCTIQDQSKNWQGKKFTCIKSGKKLIWGKGVPLDKPVALPTGTPSPTPSPSPLIVEAIQRKDWELTYLNIWDEYNAAQTQGTFPFVYKLSPTVNKVKVQESIQAYDKAMKIWLAILNGAQVSPISWTIMSENDYSWWKNVMEEQEKIRPSYAWDPTTNMLGHCSLSPRAFCGYGLSYQSKTSNYKFLQYNVIGSEYTGTPNANVVNHESVHFYQLSVVDGFPQDTPCWYVEGQASLYGGALQHNLDSERYLAMNQRNRFKNIVREYQPNADKYSSPEWIQILQNMYSSHLSCSSQQDYFKYATGMFNWEYLYSNYGSKTMHKVLLEFKAGRTFSESIQNILNLTVDQLNLRLADHLVHVFARGN